MINAAMTMPPDEIASPNMCITAARTLTSDFPSRRNESEIAAFRTMATSAVISMARSLTAFGMTEPVDRFDEDVDRESDERSGIDECREHAGAVIAVRLFHRRLAAFELDRTEREQKRDAVGEVVKRVADQRQRMREVSDGELDRDE